MKSLRIAMLIPLALWLGQGCKKSSTSGGAPVPPYVHDTSAMRTAVGTPSGNPVSKTIDASGGTIISSDGVLELDIPAGALPAPTNIAIQPVTNEVPIGLYQGYSLTPNGQQFQKPVTLTFHYKDQDLDTSDPAGLSVGYQTGDQTWEVFTDVTVDTVSKTVSVQTPHFTIFDLLPDLRISPEEAIIGVGKTLHLDQQIHFDADPYARIPSYVRYTSSWDNVNDGPVRSGTVWAVNNIKGGNKTVGTITTANDASAVYTAPATVPSPSTVFATVTHQYYKAKVILRSKLRIVDGAAFHVLLQYFAPNINESGSYYNWSDAGSFDVTLSNGSGSVINVSNRSATITLDHDSSTCTTTLVDPPVGPINITYESGSFVLYYANMVSIHFDALDPNYYIRDAVWKTQCPGGQPTQSGGGLGPPFPASLQFQALDGTQTIVNGQYTMTVTRIQ
jgi:hypothetical protein